MKANLRAAPLHVAAMMTAGALAACVSPPPARPVAAAPAATPVAVAPMQAPRDWRDAAPTPGTWRWGEEGGQSVARFADGLLVLRCDRARRGVELWRRGDPGAAATGGTGVPMSVDTTALTRPLSGTLVPGPPPGMVLRFSADDPLLDAMAFSRGRFAIEAAGLPTLIAPSWPEVARVIEDCR